MSDQYSLSFTPQKLGPELLVLDGTAMLFRAYYSMSYQGPDGSEVGAILGVSNQLARILQRVPIAHVAIAFDAGQKTFRNDLDPRYKANRGAPPPDLVPQFEWVRQMCDALGFWNLSIVGFEADDLMASLSALARQAHMPCRVRALDKDLWQLVADAKPATTLEDPRTDSLIREIDVVERFGVPVERLRDYFALVGDSSDNVPGAAGVGPKAASAIMAHFPTLENAYSNLDEIKSLSVRGAKTLGDKLLKSRQDVQLAQQLIALRYDVDMGLTAQNLEEKTLWNGPDQHKLEAFQKQVGFQGGFPTLARLGQRHTHG